MTKGFRFILYGVILVLAVLNLILLVQMSTLGKENQTLLRKVTPSLGQQFDLYEHSLEGVNLADLLDHFRGRDADLGNTGERRLIYYFPGEHCRRTLHLEMTMLHKFEDRFRQEGIHTLAVFSDFEQTDFLTLAQQFGISDLSLLDRDNVFRRRFGIRPSTLVMLLDSSDTVVYARVSRNGDEEGSLRFCEKILNASY